MKESLKLITVLIILIITIASLIGGVYFLFAGIWGFNPTEIEWFNLKGFLSALIISVLCVFTIKVIEKLEN